MGNQSYRVILSTNWAKITESEMTMITQAHRVNKVMTMKVKIHPSHTSVCIQPSTLENENIGASDTRDEDSVNSEDSVNEEGDEVESNTEGDEEIEMTEKSATEVETRRYNLTSRSTVNYLDMHKYGETQLLQLHQDWVNKQLCSSSTTNDNK